MVAVRFSNAATGDLRDIYAFLKYERKEPDLAFRVIDKLYEDIITLIQPNPFIGRPADPKNENRRVLLVLGRYKIYYELSEDIAVIRSVIPSESIRDANFNEFE